MNQPLQTLTPDRAKTIFQAMHPWPNVVLKGALAGVVATAAMSGVMLLAQRLGVMGRVPPRQIVEDALRAIRVHGATTPRSRKLLAAAAHVGFGATQGVLFATLLQAPVLLGRQVGVPTANKGIAFGLGVWVSSYAGWIPLFGILPLPDRDRPGRPTSMVIAHIVYGLVLAKSLARGLTRRGSQPIPVSSQAGT